MWNEDNSNGKQTPVWLVWILYNDTDQKTGDKFKRQSIALWKEKNFVTESLHLVLPSCKCICTTHIQISSGYDQYLAMKMEIEIWNFSILCNSVSRYVCVANCQLFHICVYSVLATLQSTPLAILVSNKFLCPRRRFHKT